MSESENIINTRNEDGSINLDATAAFAALVTAGTEARTGSDIPARLQEQFDAAIVTLAAVCPSMNPLTTVALPLEGTRKSPGAADRYMEAILESKGVAIKPYKARKMVQKAWQDAVNAPETRIGRVTWSIDEPTPLDTQLCFVNLSASSAYYVEGEQEVAIIAYTPETTRVSLNTRSGELEETGSWYDTNGYSHVVGWVADEEDADNLLRALRLAMSTMQRVRVATQYSDDPVQSAVQQDVDGKFQKGPKVSAF